MIQSITEKIFNGVSSFVGMLSRNPRVITISLIVGGIFVGLGLFFSRRRKEFKAKKEPPTSPGTKKTEDVVDRKLVSPLDAFMELVKGQSFVALFGDKKIEDIPFCKADNFSNLRLDKPIEKGVTKDGVAFLAMQVRYQLTSDDIIRMNLKSLDSNTSDTEKSVISSYLAKPQGNAHVIFYKEKKLWKQLQPQGVLYPFFFSTAFSPAGAPWFKDAYAAVKALVQNECKDLNFGFTWYLGHK